MNRLWISTCRLSSVAYLSPEKPGNTFDLSHWQEMVDAAQRQYEDARNRVAETAVMLVMRPIPDAYSEHRIALEEEVQALRKYRGLLAAYKDF